MNLIIQFVSRDKIDDRGEQSHTPTIYSTSRHITADNVKREQDIHCSRSEEDV